MKNFKFEFSFCAKCFLMCYGILMNREKRKIGLKFVLVFWNRYENRRFSARFGWFLHYEMPEFSPKNMILLKKIIKRLVSLQIMKYYSTGKLRMNRKLLFFKKIIFLFLGVFGGPRNPPKIEKIGFLGAPKHPPK